MKKLNKRMAVLALLLSTGFVSGQNVLATSSLDNNASVTVEDSGKTDPVDPENPIEVVDPGPGVSTDGALRVDFVTDLGFGLNKITDNERTYSSLAQLFHSETEARGYYVQITDNRSDVSGWELQLTQESQFSNSIIQNAQEQELVGATLSFAKGWANSAGTTTPPTITNQTIAISEIGTAYTVATAGQNQAKGTWTIAFGGSPGYQANDPEGTLTPIVNADEQPQINETYNKQDYSNSAIQLSIPNNTKIYPVQYTTSLRWTLVAGPS